MDPYLHRICEVLETPDFVYSRPRTNTHIYYKSGICTDEHTSSYFVVYVSYNDYQRVIETAYSRGHLPTELFRIHPQ